MAVRMQNLNGIALFCSDDSIGKTEVEEILVAVIHRGGPMKEVVVRKSFLFIISGLFLLSGCSEDDSGGLGTDPDREPGDGDTDQSDIPTDTERDLGTDTEPSGGDLDTEFVKADAEMVDARWFLDGVQPEEAFTKSQIDSVLLPGNLGDAEKRGVEFAGPFHVRHAQRHVIQ